MLFLVVCSAPFREEFERSLLEKGIDGYTLVPKVFGRGGESEPVMDNEVWPGFSVLFLIFVEGDKVGKLKEILGEFSRKVKPFKAFALREVEVI
jgi:hypothetical protein